MKQRQHLFNITYQKSGVLESIVDSDGDGHTDDAEETAGTSAIDASDFPIDFSDSVDEIIGEGSGLDTIESNLKFWFDASNIDAESNATLTDGDAISRWRDLRNGFDATQGTASRQPTIINNTQNGMSGVNFPGAANNGLLTSGTSDEVIGDFAMIVVAKIDTSQDMHTIARETLDGLGIGENYTDWSLQFIELVMVIYRGVLQHHLQQVGLQLTMSFQVNDSIF